MTLWIRDGDGFVDEESPARRRAACPDCTRPWDVERESRCPTCGLDVDDLAAAAEFLDRLRLVS